MRDKIFLFGMFFLLMAALPLCLMVQNNGTSIISSSKNSQNADIAGADAEVLKIASICGESLCDEAVRAAVIIGKTNAAAHYDAEKSDKTPGIEQVRLVKNFYDSEKEILTINGKPVAVPYSACSNGYTVFSKDFAYLEAVASPWDSFCAEYDASAKCEGVSLSGIQYLCAKGLSAEEALQWYLPQLKLTEVRE